MRMLKYISFVTVLISTALTGRAQDVVKADTGKAYEHKIKWRRLSFAPGVVYVNFKDAIANATELYNNGEYDTCISVIEYSFRDRNSNMFERESLLELLVECYLEKDDLPNAERAIVRLLHNNPHYEVNETGNNTEDFKKLVDQYEIFPGLSIGIRNTELKSTYVTTKTYALPNVTGINYATPYTSNYKWEVMYYSCLEYQFTKNWSVGAEAIKYVQGYNRLMVNDSTNYASYSEYMTIYRLPLYLRRYGKIAKGFSYYAGLGLSVNMAGLSTAHVEYYDFPKNIVENGDMDVTNIKNQYSFQWLATGGVGYTIKRIRLFVDLRYYGGISNLVSASNRHANQQLQDTYHYVDGDVKVNQFEFGAEGAIILNYKVKKKK